MSTNNNNIKDIEARIAAAKPSNKPSISTPPSNTALHLITELLGGVITGVIIGYNMDKWLSTPPLFLVILTIIGGISGGYSFYKHEIRKQGNNHA